MLLACLALSTAAPVARAQPDTPAKVGQAPGGAKSDQPRLLDEVTMTVDDKVILRSEIVEEYLATIVARRGDEKPTPREQRLIYQQVRFNRLKFAKRAQSAWSVPNASPERIEQIVEQELRRRQDQRIRDFGSVNRMKEEMGLMDKSIFMVRRREREQILYELAQADLRRRFRDRIALMVTPKALREHYRRRAPEMRSAASCDLQMVRFPVADPATREAVRARAAEAARHWAAGGDTAGQIAARHDGQALPDRTGLTTAAAGKLQPFIRDFVTSSRAVRVSEPLPHGSAYWVLKVAAVRAGDPFRWEDPKVQERLRHELLALQLEELGRRMDRERQKTLLIWPPQGGWQR